jgi:fatty-acyl-CoA synthase
MTGNVPFSYRDGPEDRDMESILTIRENTLLWDVWEHHAETRPDEEAVVHWKNDGDPYRWTWARIVEAAASFARHIRKEGIRRGDICAVVIRHHEGFYPLYMGIGLAGAVPAVLAYPNPRIHPEKFRQGLEGMARHSGLDWIFTEKSLEEMVRPLVQKESSTIRGMLFPLEWPREPHGRSARSEMLSGLRRDARPEDPCLLQHSSGTTGLQKAVVLSHSAVLKHVFLYGRSIRLRREDKIVSWLPLYHDMGLIAAFHLPLACGIPTIQIDPFEWVQAPVLLQKAISREGGTLSWLPNFTYNLLADRVREDDLDGIRLDSVRMLINCSEPVRNESHEKFLRRYSPYGLKPETLAACYAMAETTFAATQTEPGRSARVLVAVREELARGRYEPHVAGSGKNTKTCVSSGAAIPGCSLKVVDEEGAELPDGRVGEIAIRSVSMFDGYRNQPEKTAEVLKGDWYFSGDYGFRHEGEYYVIGRKKDIIIVAGHNIAPEDVEDAVNEVSGVLPGRTVAFGVEDPETGTEKVYVVAETAETTETGLKALRREIGEAGIRINVAIARVYLVPPRWLIKSSSGKLSRKLNRQRVLEAFPER